MYIGKQKILNEEFVDGKHVRVTLEALDLDGLESKEETIMFHKDILKDIITEEENTDDTELRNKRCSRVIEEMVLTLLKYNCQLHDLNHIFENTGETIRQARLKSERKAYGNNEYKRTVQQYAEELLQ